MPTAPTPDNRPIGVFDSGVGGLTVARALMDLLPEERLVYFGDTARGPYGPRDLAEVRGFTTEIVAFLTAQDVKLVVAACNTATAASLDPADPMPFDLPVVGVIEPAVRAAVRATRSGRIGVIGTVGTIGSGAYERAIATVDPAVGVVSQACPRFVELAERGRTTDPGVLDVAQEYLAPLAEQRVDTVILGCTHYPLLTGVIAYVLGPQVTLVSSAEETARAVFTRLVDSGLLAHRDDAGHEPGDDPGHEFGHEPGHRFIASGDRREFARLAARFLGPRLAEPDVERVAALGTSQGEVA